MEGYNCQKIVMKVTINARNSRSFFLKMHFKIRNPVKKIKQRDRGMKVERNILLTKSLFTKKVRLLDLRKQSTEIMLEELWPIVCMGWNIWRKNVGNTYPKLTTLEMTWE